MTGRPPLYDDGLIQTVIDMIQEYGLTHSEIAEATGIPRSTVGDIALRARVRRTTGDLRGGSRVRGQVNRARIHQRLKRTLCVMCKKECTRLADGWCAKCLQTEPITAAKVVALATEFEFEDAEEEQSGIILSAALLLPAGQVRPDVIQSIVGSTDIIRRIIDRYVEHGFFSTDGHLCLETCPAEQDEVLFAVAILCGAGKIVRVSS